MGWSSVFKYILALLLVGDILVHSLTNLQLYDLRANISSIKAGSRRVVEVADTVSGGIVKKGAMAYDGVKMGIAYVQKKLHKKSLKS
jgi:hypothetical protein